MSNLCVNDVISNKLIITTEPTMNAIDKLAIPAVPDHIVKPRNVPNAIKNTTANHVVFATRISSLFRDEEVFMMKESTTTFINHLP